MEVSKYIYIYILILKNMMIFYKFAFYANETVWH